MANIAGQPMTDLRYVFAFTSARPEVAAFYRDVLGLDIEETKDDAVWFATQGARFAVHDDDDPETAREVREGHTFVVGIGVDDLDGAYERARRAGAVVGDRFESWFFVRDPDGRFAIVAPTRREASTLASNEPRHLEDDLLSFFGAGRWSPWFTSLTQALDGVDHIYASRAPLEGLNSIWAVVNHISFWHELALRRLRGEPTTDEEAVESGWSLRATGGANEWTHVREQLLSRNVAFARAVGTLSPSELEMPWAPGRAPRWQLAYGLMNHTSHHTADVLIVRRLLGIPLETR